jgi:hypothetical protein
MIFASDSRTNAGVDQIATFCKTRVYERPDDRVIVVLSAGNLGMTQGVTNILDRHIHAAPRGVDQEGERSTRRCEVRRRDPKALARAAQQCRQHTQHLVLSASGPRIKYQHSTILRRGHLDHPAHATSAATVVLSSELTLQLTLDGPLQST